MERFGTVVIIGAGLIGGSIGMALRSRGLAQRVVGLGRDLGRLEEARRLGALDEGFVDPHAALRDADVAVVCTPVGRIVRDVATAVEHGPPGLLVTDAGSTKQEIVAGVEAQEATCRAFVAAHPLAGSERTGVSAARTDLFEGRICVLTPTPRTSPDRLERARAFWSGLGCRLLELAPQAHDDALARTSHLPHVVASALAASVPPEDLALAAGAYRDGTRVALADGSLWAQIFLANRAGVLAALDRFEERLGALRAGIEANDPDHLLEAWRIGQSHRERFLKE